MDSHKLIIKFFTEDTTQVEESAFVPVFHSLIQAHALPDHLLIDVADYTHVPDGPGTVLVSHEANVYIDHTVDKRAGLMYQRKQPIAGAESFRDRLAHVFASALRVAALLEENPAFEGRLTGGSTPGSPGVSVYRSRGVRAARWSETRARLGSANGMPRCSSRSSSMN
jgi:hypothetical protein